MKNKIKETLILLAKTHTTTLDYLRTDLTDSKIILELYSDCLNELLKLDDVNNNFKWDFQIERGSMYRYTSDVTCKSTHVIEFPRLYLNTILKLHDTNLIEFNNDAYGNILIGIIRNINEFKTEFGSNTNAWFLTKIFLNWSYGFIGSDKNRYKIDNYKIISLYCKGIFDMLIEMCPKSIISINVDEIYIQHYDIIYVKRAIHHVLDKTGLPYIVEKL
jgi:hypothetical protein